MPVFKDIDKVIVIPGEGGGGGGCLKPFLVVMGLLFVYAWWHEESRKPKPSESPQTLTPPQQAPKQQPRAPQLQFVPLGPNTYPSPNPLPSIVGRHPTNGDPIYQWRGQRWFVQNPRKPYQYLCDVSGTLQICWHNPPNSSAIACVRSVDGAQGWCWNQ